MVRLVPMTPLEFARYLETAIRDYADAHLKSGDCEADEALALAQADYDSLLPDGLSTPNHHLFSVFAEGAEPIGLIWYEARDREGRKSAFIYDFIIRPELRGKGYGAATLRALEARLREGGVRRVNLNVMGWNVKARELYEREGFTIAGIGMTKMLA